MLKVYAVNGFERTAATRKRLSGLTLIGITLAPALKRGPACSRPSVVSVYMPISPSSAFDTYTYVAALTGRLSAAPSSAVSSFHMGSPSPEDYFLHGERHAT